MLAESPGLAQGFFNWFDFSLSWDYNRIMEADKNPFPKLDLFPRVAAVSRFLGGLLTPFHTDAADYLSNHHRGAADMLDQQLYEQGRLDLDRATAPDIAGRDL